ncbi:hypothetical protein TcasGA2_TC001837 [Tribolium castaneum]|uniref:Uncharacterized protein n=1 Tax=Tribolium castaneum TaxID=7070 RepID=D7EJ70_TRICA|nr:hypothetical protein TcasGA2_TC001837 [Tribolium castaneum]
MYGEAIVLQLGHFEFQTKAIVADIVDDFILVLDVELVPEDGRIGSRRSGRNRAFSRSCSLCIKPVSNSGGRAVHQTGKTFSDEWCLLRIKPAHHLHRPDRPRAPTSGACCASNQHTISTAQTDLGLVGKLRPRTTV